MTKQNQIKLIRLTQKKSGITRSVVWDESKPLPLDFPTRHVLQRIEGRYWIHSISTHAGANAPSQVFQGSRASTESMDLEIAESNPIVLPFGQLDPNATLREEELKNSVLQIYELSGNQYVERIFSLNPGESVQLNSDQKLEFTSDYRFELNQTTVTLSELVALNSRYRFHLVQKPKKRLAAAPALLSFLADREIGLVMKTLAASAIGLAALFLIFRSNPMEETTQALTLNEPTQVQFKLPKPRAKPKALGGVPEAQIAQGNPTANSGGATSSGSPGKAGRVAQALRTIGKKPIESLAQYVGGLLSRTKNSFLNPTAGSADGTGSAASGSGFGKSGITKNTGGAGNAGPMAVGSMAVGQIGGRGVGPVGYDSGNRGSVRGQGNSPVAVGNGDGEEIDEGLTRAEILKVINQHRNQMRYCYSTAKLRNPGLGPQMSLSFAIIATGRVSTALVDHSTQKDEILETCLVGLFKGMQFPNPRGGKTVSSNYPLNFRNFAGDRT